MYQNEVISNKKRDYSFGLTQNHISHLEQYACSSPEHASILRSHALNGCHVLHFGHLIYSISLFLFYVGLYVV